MTVPSTHQHYASSKKHLHTWVLLQRVTGAASWTEHPLVTGYLKKKKKKGQDVVLPRLFQHTMCFMSLRILTSIAKHDRKLFIFFPTPSETKNILLPRRRPRGSCRPSNLILSEKSQQPKGGFQGILVQFLFIYPRGWSIIVLWSPDFPAGTTVKLTLVPFHLDNWLWLSPCHSFWLQSSPCHENVFIYTLLANIATSLSLTSYYDSN